MYKLLLFFLSAFISLDVYCQVLSGRITDEENNPIPHANIIINNSKRGTSSDKNGSFKIKDIDLNKINEITVSYIGYKTNKITINPGNTKDIKIVLVKDAFSVKEVLIEAKKEEYFESILLPIRVKSIDSIEIRHMPSNSSAKMFNNISGVNVSSEFGIFSSSTTVSLRGIGGNSQNGTLVLVDGSPVNKSDAGSVNWNIIDKDNIEKIEIIKGPGSALFGTNAMGGIINIITRQPSEKFSLLTSASYGTYNTIDAKLNLSGRSANGLFYWKYFGSIKTSDGYINTPDEVIKENDTVIVPVFLDEKFTGALAGYNINENNKVELSFNYFNDIRGRGIKIYEYEGANVERHTYHSFAKYKGQIKKMRLFANLFSLYEDYFRLNEYYSDGEYNLYEVSSVRNDYGSKLWAELPLNRNNSLIFGSDIKTGSVNGADIYYTASDVIRNKGKMDIYSAFIQNTTSLLKSKLSLVAGLRYDYASFHDAGFSIETPSYSVEYMYEFVFDNIATKHWSSLSPKLALEYRFSDNFKNYISAGKGFRAPILDELCRNEERRMGFRIANPEIKPEYIFNFEYGFDAVIKEKIKTNASIFYSAGNDFMYLLRTGDSVNLGYTWAPVYKIDNISKVNIYGAEFDINYSITKKIRAFANYSYNIGKISNISGDALSYNDLTGKYLIDIPAHKYSLGFIFENKYVNLSLSGKYTGERWIMDDNTVDEIYLLSDKYPAYYMIDMKVWKKIKNFELSCEVDNLGNVIYTNSKGYKSHGRFILLRLSYFLNK